MKANLDKFYKEGFTSFPNLILCDDRLTCQEKMVIIVLWAHSGGKETCFPGQKTIAKEARVSKRTVRSATKKARTFGYIDFKKSSRYYTYTLHYNKESKLQPITLKRKGNLFEDFTVFLQKENRANFPL